MDCAAWSRESVALMSARTNALVTRHVLDAGAPYRLDLEAGTIPIGNATFRLVTVGTVANEQFLWSWADDSLPAR